MATPSVTYTFAPNTLIKASEANTNFQDIIDFLTNEVIQKDASTAFTVTPSGPSTDPTADDQFTRKAYVDRLASRRLGGHSVTNETFGVTNSIADMGVSASFTVPELGNGRYLEVSLYVPWVKFGGAINQGDVAQVILARGDNEIIQRRRVQARYSYASDYTNGLYMVRTIAANDAYFVAGQNRSVKVRGNIPTGSMALVGTSSSPIELTVKVV